MSLFQILVQCVSMLTHNATEPNGNAISFACIWLEKCWATTTDEGPSMKSEGIPKDVQIHPEENVNHISLKTTNVNLMEHKMKSPGITKVIRIDSLLTINVN